MKRTVDALYWIGDIVFLRVNEERKPGMITRLVISGTVVYWVTWRGGSETAHYECELSSEYVPDYGVAELQQTPTDEKR